jgi:hypothetical protein
MTETWWEILFWQCTELGDPLIANEKSWADNKKKKVQSHGTCVLCLSDLVSDSVSCTNVETIKSF